MDNRGQYNWGAIEDFEQIWIETIIIKLTECVFVAKLQSTSFLFMFSMATYKMNNTSTKNKIVRVQNSTI